MKNKLQSKLIFNNRLFQLLKKIINLYYKNVNIQINKSKKEVYDQSEL